MCATNSNAQHGESHVVTVKDGIILKVSASVRLTLCKKHKMMSKTTLNGLLRLREIDKNETVSVL